MNKTVCPTCGQKTVDLNLCRTDLFLNAMGLRLGPVATAILLALKTGPLTTHQLAERIYSNCHNPPIFPLKAINIAIAKVKRKLPKFGWTITNEYGSGRNGAVYRLHSIKTL